MKRSLRTINKLIPLIALAALNGCSGGGGAPSAPAATAGVYLSQSALSTTEDGTEATFAVSLTTQPSSDVDLTFTARDTTEGLIGSDTNTDYWAAWDFWNSTVDLTFTKDNWNVPQIIKVQGQPDYQIDGNQTYGVDVTWLWSMDLNYVAATKPGVSVTNIDTSAPGISISAADITTSENRTSTSFSVRLNLAPTSTVTIPLTINDASEGSFDYYSSLTQKSLTFDSTNWSTSQYVYVYGVDDVASDGNQTYTISVGPATSSDTGYSGMSGNDVSVTNTDNDTAAYTVSKTALSTTEWGQSATFTVVLNTEPASDVVIPVTSLDTSEGLVSSAALPTAAASVDLTFTPVNWQVAQTVTVSPVNDADQDGDISYNVTVGAPTGDSFYSALAAKTVAIVNVDDDTAKVNIQGADLQTAESGTTATFVVSLAKAPTDNVVLNVTSGDPTEGRIKGGSSPSVPVDAITLTFTTADWQTPRTVTVVGQDDVEIDGNQTYLVDVSIDSALTLDSEYDVLPAQSVSVTNADGDKAGMTIIGNISVSESGTTDSFTVNLNTKPTADVVIPINLEYPTQLEVSDNGTTFASSVSLTFTPTNWSTPQTVTFRAIDDFIDESSMSVIITVGSATSADINYNGLAAVTKSASISDNDTAGLVVTPSTGLTTTELSSTTFTLALATQPTANVFVTVSSGNTAEGLLTGGDSPSTPVDTITLEFTPATWQSGQTVTVIGQDDVVLDGPISYDLTIIVLDGADSYYNGVSNKLVGVTNYDSEAGVSETKTLARTELPYNGQVAKASTSSYSLTGLASGWKHTLTADNVTDDIALTIKDGTTVLCSSAITGVKAAESCAFKVPASGTVTVEISGASTNNGAGFTLSLSAPTYPVTIESFNESMLWTNMKLFDAAILTSSVPALKSITTYSGSSSMTYDLTGGATYYLKITPYVSGDIGNYTLQVTQASANLTKAGTAVTTAGEPNDDAASAYALSLETPFASYLSDADIDWYKFTAPAAPY